MRYQAALRPDRCSYTDNTSLFNFRKEKEMIQIVNFDGSLWGHIGVFISQIIRRIISVFYLGILFGVFMGFASQVSVPRINRVALSNFVFLINKIKK